MALFGKDTKRMKIVVENRVLDQVNHFNYLCTIKNKQIWTYLRHNQQKLDTQNKERWFHKAVTVPKLLYGRIIMVTLIKKQESHIQDRIRNTYIRSGQQIYCIDYKMKEN